MLIGGNLALVVSSIGVEPRRPASILFSEDVGGRATGSTG